MNRLIYKTLLFWSYFISIGGMLGTAMMFIDSSGEMWGLNKLLPILKARLPLFTSLFDNLIASGIVLFVVVSIPNILSLYLLHKRSQWGKISAFICGFILMGFMSFEIYIWGMTILSLLYFIFGFIQSFSAWRLICRKNNCVQ